MRTNFSVPGREVVGVQVSQIEKIRARALDTFPDTIRGQGHTQKSDSQKARPADSVCFMPEGDRDNQTAPILRVMLSAAIVVSAVTLAVAIVIAVIVDVQSDYLGARSEQGGGFDPSVFPPGNGALWLIGNTFPVLLAILLVVLIAARIVAGTRPDRHRTNDNNLLASGR